MEPLARVLDPEPVADLRAHEARGGGRGIEALNALDPAGALAALEASGLRGRGGAGFPTAAKWRAVVEHGGDEPPTVVVNAAEGEPGTFKDRAIIRANPYRVLEGALIAAATVGADGVVVAVKRSFERETIRLRTAIDELRAAGWTGDVEVDVVAGPEEYLFGEETALLEALDGRAPFPRIAPPFRHGVEEESLDPSEPPGEPAETGMAGPASDAAPTLVNNVETLANVPGILAEGPEWFRSVGTEQSPGTVVVTVTGSTVRHGVGEVPMGMPLAEAIDRIGGGARRGQRFVAALSGVANPLLPYELFGTPLSHEDLAAAGAGLGAAGFIVLDDTDDLVAVVHGVSRFLAIESCGQCEPCKADGLALAGLLDRLRQSDLDEAGVVEIGDRVRTVANEARCYLATQHERVVGSLLSLFPDVVKEHVTAASPPGEPVLIAPIVELDDEGATLDGSHAGKQPDWTYDERDSGQWPAARIDQRQHAR